MPTSQTRRYRGSKLVSHPLVVEWEAQGDPALRLAYGLLIAIGVLLTLASAAFGATVQAGAATSTVAAPASPAPNMANPGAVTLATLRAGALVQVPANKLSVYATLPLRAAAMEATVTGSIVRTRLTQRFKNTASTPVEGMYLIPLPNRAQVDGLKIKIGERYIQGVIGPRQPRAGDKTADFAKIIAGRRPDMFAAALGILAPGETVVVQLEYQDRVVKKASGSILRLPGLKPPGTAASLKAPVRVHLDTGFGIEHLAAPRNGMGKLKISTSGETGKQISGNAPQSGNFQLTWKPVAAPQGVRVFSERANGEDYLLVTVAPPAINRPEDRRTREVVFVLDTSASMSGMPIREAKKSISLALGRLTSGDRFNVITFNDQLDAAFPAPEAASSQNIERARRFIETLETSGGSEMLPALRAAMVDLPPKQSRHQQWGQSRAQYAPTLRRIVFLTDGAITDQAAFLPELKRGLGRARLFTVGLGGAPAKGFMQAISALGGGTFTHIAPANMGGHALSDLFNRLETPALTDIRVTWPDGADAVLGQPRIANVYGKGELEFTARLKRATGRAVISGYSGARLWSASVDLATASKGSGIAKRWAQTRIAHIEYQRFDGVAASTIEEKVANLALATGSLSRVTSLNPALVAPVSAGPIAARALPRALPEGWDFSMLETGNPPVRAAGFDRRFSRPNGGPQQGAIATLQPDRQPVPASPRTSVVNGFGATLGFIALGFALALGLGLAFFVWIKFTRQPPTLRPTAAVSI